MRCRSSFVWVTSQLQGSKNVEQRQLACSRHQPLVQRFFHVSGVFGHQWHVAQLHVTDQVGIECRNVSSTGAGANEVHGVDEQPEVGIPEVLHGGERRSQVGYRPRSDFDAGLDAERVGHCSDLCKLIERSTHFPVAARNIDATNLELTQNIEIGGIFAHIAIGSDAETFA
jgi:hypothetical protein